MAQPPNLARKFGGCFSLRAGSHRPAGTDRARAWAAGETVEQIGPGLVKLPGPVLVEQRETGRGFSCLFNVRKSVLFQTVKTFKKKLDKFSRKRLTIKKTLDIIQSSRKRLIAHCTLKI